MRAVIILMVLPLVANARFFWEQSEQDAVGAVDAACVEKANAGDCDFYTCFDERHPCTSNNWALSYGWRFCKRFDQKYEEFNDEGKVYINATRACTMRNMLYFYNDDTIHCKDSETAMNRMHAECEQEGGVCNLEMLLDNKDALLDIYSFSRHTLNRFLQFVGRCSEPSLRQFVENIREQSDLAQPYLDTIQDLIEEMRRRENWRLPEIDWPEFDLGLDRIELPSFDFSFGADDSEE